MIVKAVIGANYGDEGKGLMTDALSHPGSLVVRYNGGAQAGHTVVRPDGKRHVFSHFGSGTLAGADTYLSEFFIVNPVLWRREWFNLDKPALLVNPLAMLTTPYDMLVNQALGRGNTCGMGINETVTRCTRKIDSGLDMYKTNAAQLQLPGLLREVLRQIRHHYFPARCRELGIKKPYEDREEALDIIDAAFLYDCNQFANNATFTFMPEGYDYVVFEGAQGLLLDEDHPNFPFVTRSKTGLHNVRLICRQYGWKLDEAIYVTRAYLTRHGAGPFPTEVSGLAYHDDTNLPNSFQGQLRFGTLDGEGLRERVLADADSDNFSVCVTHLDQLPGEAMNPLLDEHVYWWNPGNTYVSFGPTREDVGT